MKTKKLSAKGVFEVRKKHKRTEFFKKCEELVDDQKEQLVKFDSSKRFWEAKEKIKATFYKTCCELLKINPEESEDRSPWQFNISAIELQQKLDLPEVIAIKSTSYNQISLSELEIGLEPDHIVISGKWQGVFRDNYYDIIQELPLVGSFIRSAEIEVFELENKKFLQVSSEGNFYLKCPISCIDLKIKFHPNNITIGFNNQIHQAFCDFFSKYKQRITEPIMNYKIVSEEILQKIVEDKVKHEFFKIIYLSVNDNSMNFTIDESYTLNKERVDLELASSNDIK